jgi:hypothetical protein
MEEFDLDFGSTAQDPCLRAAGGRAKEDGSISGGEISPPSRSPFLAKRLNGNSASHTEASG